jgi:hypothetical protein
MLVAGELVGKDGGEVLLVAGEVPRVEPDIV